MCRLCDRGEPQHHGRDATGGGGRNPRRHWLKTGGAIAASAGTLALFRPATTQAKDDREPEDSGRRGRRYVIRGGAVMSMDPTVGDFARGRRAGRGQEDPRRRPQPARRRRGGDRRARPHRDAGLHRHAPPPVRDGAAQLPRRRHPDQRRLGHAERRPELFRVHPADVRAGLPAAGRLHQRAVRRPLRSSTTASRRCTTSRRSITRRSTPTPRSRRCSIPAAAPPSAISRARATSPATSIRTTRPASSSSGSLERPARPMIMGGEVYLPGYETGLDDRPRSSASRSRRTSSSPFGIRPIFDELAAGRRRQRHFGIGPTTCSST